MKIGNGIKSNNYLDGLNYFLLIFVFFTFFISCKNETSERELYSLAGSTMGTTYSLKIIEPSKSLKLKNLDKKIDSILVDVNQKMSTYIPNSELSLFNQNQDTCWIKISEDLAHVISTSKRVSKESGNVFDITIGPIVNLWGFGPTKSEEEIPEESKIKELLEEVGIDKIQLDSINLKIRKSNPNIYVDLSAIAKGFGVDKVGLFLESMNLNEYMIEIGGEVRTRGKNKDNEKWKIGISTPNNNGLQKILGISGYSAATSGDYFNYFEKEGIRYSHTIDPRTGKPITHKLASVTVIYKDCEEADAYATAIDVLGPEAGFEFALNMKLPIFMIVREENNFIKKMTPQFEDFIIKGN